tara:strand:+ start:845 stop:1669 length:825 start_codon:yes stop_codon:yes gene_type:complete
MKKNIIIIGKKGFISSNLFLNLRHKQNLKIYDYKRFLNLKEAYIDKFDYVINCSINQSYIKKKYSQDKDSNFMIAKKIENLSIKMIFLSSRKVYKSKYNLKENDVLLPRCNYSKNKIISENILKKILNERVLILRISNLVGPYKSNKKKLHKTFIDIFFQNIKKGIILKNNKYYKDFLSVKKFSQIVNELIKINAKGIYNVSIGKKIYLTEIIEWLNYYNKKEYKYVKLSKHQNNDNFTLNNHKLMKKINIINEVDNLKNDCKMISKHFFKNKK